nr:hypothetical protein [Oleomonas cavernae]
MRQRREATRPRRRAPRPAGAAGRPGLRVDGDLELVERQRQAQAAGLHIGLLGNPAAIEGLGPQPVRAGRQGRLFAGRKEARGNLGHRDGGADFLDIEADGQARDGDRHLAAGAREAELDPARTFCSRLAKTTILKANICTRSADIIGQGHPQEGAALEEFFSIGYEMKLICAGYFIMTANKRKLGDSQIERLKARYPKMNISWIDAHDFLPTWYAKQPAQKHREY